MNLDTDIAGDPASVATTAEWLGGLHRAVDDAADTLRRPRPAEGWEGKSARAFGRWSESSAEATDQVAGRIDRAATDLTAYAAALELAQRRMTNLRAEARSDGLQVDGHVVVDPGDGPLDPGRLPSAPRGLKVPAAALARHAGAVTLFETHVALARAFREAVEKATEIRSELDDAVAQVQRGYDALRSQGWITHGLGILDEALELRAAGDSTPDGGVVVGLGPQWAPHYDLDQISPLNLKR